MLAVLQCQADAPLDLRERSLVLAGEVLELSGKVAVGDGYAVARDILDDGRAWNKFQAICEAQGGMRQPGVAPHRHAVRAKNGGTVTAIDNRRLSLAAKLAGAPLARTAGIDLHVKLGMPVEAGQPLFTLHAEAPGELDYALRYLASQTGIVAVGPEQQSLDKQSA